MKTLHVFSVLFIPTLAVASTAATVLSESELTRQVAALVENKTLQAVSLGVIQPDGSTTGHAGTLAPDDLKSPNDHTLYEIGSISKVFTSLLLADAVVRGEVTLDTPVSKLLPEDVALPDGAGGRITLRMLATHTSGLPRTPPGIPTGDYVNPYSNYGEVELWESLRQVKLDFEPGSKAAYSNLGGGLLGALLARNAGLTYAELLRVRITQPLGMVDTVVQSGADLEPRFAPPFNASGERWTHWDFKALAGAGGIRSTMADMMRFAAAMIHSVDTPLREAIDLVWERQDLAATITPAGQALGWFLAGDGHTHWHNGMTGGYHAAMFVNRELRVATIVLANRSTPVGTEVADGLFRRAAGLPERLAPNRDRAEVALAPEQLDRCTGTFRMSPQSALVVERQNLALFVTPTGQPTDRLFAASPDTFFSRRAPAELVFELSNNGEPAAALVLRQGGRQMRAVRE